MPYGIKWEKEMEKLSKRTLEEFFGISGQGITKKKLIELIKHKLTSQDKKLWG